MLSRIKDRIRQAALLLGLAMLTASCLGAPVVTIVPGQPVPVALLLPYGYGDPDHETLARNFENAARLAISDLRGVRINLSVYETRGDPARGAMAARQAVSDGAKIILGPLFSDVAESAAKAVAERGVSVLSFSNNPEVAGRNLFLLGHTSENAARHLVRYALEAGKTRIMVTRADNRDGELALAAIQKAYNEAIRAGFEYSNTDAFGGNVSIPALQVATPYTFSQKSVFETAPAIAEEIKAAESDAVLFTSNTSGALPLLTQLLIENGIRKKRVQFMGLTPWDIPPTTLSMPQLSGGWFALPDPAVTLRFSQKYSSAFGGRPHQLASLAYDGIAAIGALAQNGGRRALSRRSILDESGFIGVNGVFRFKKDGTVERALAIATISKQRVQILKPAARSFSAAAAPGQHIGF